MVLVAEPSLSAAVLAFLAVLAVLFSDGAWRVGFLAASAGWYGFSVAGTDQLVPVSLPQVVAVFLITSGIGGDDYSGAGVAGAAGRRTFPDAGDR